MPKYSALTRAFRKWLFPLIDRYDCGDYDPEKGHPAPRHVKERFLEMINYRSFFGMKKLTSTCIERYHAGGYANFYRSNRFGRKVLLNLDIDAHGGGVTT